MQYFFLLGQLLSSQDDVCGVSELITVTVITLCVRIWPIPLESSSNILRSCLLIENQEAIHTYDFNIS